LLSARIGRPARDPRPDDAGWANGLEVELGIIQELRAELAAVKAVPREMRTIHAAILEASGRLGEAAGTLAGAAASRNAEDLARANELISRGAEDLSRGAVLMHTYLSRVR